MGARLGARDGGEQAEDGSHGERGADGQLAVQLKDAAEAAVRCSADNRRFVNDSEECLGAFARALRRFKSKRFADERQVLEAIAEREKVVHFLLDCVRNRFPDRSRVSEIKALLTEQSPGWTRSFEEHVRVCPTCKTVDLSRAAPSAPAPPPPAPLIRRPIPFVLELCALCSWGIPLVAMLQHNNCALHWVLFLVGILLMLPLVVIQVLRARRGRAWLLSKFAAGQYAAAGALHRPLPCAWRPSRQLWWHECEEERTESAAGRTCVSFGFWMPRPALQQAAEVRLAGAAGGASVAVAEGHDRALLGSGSPAGFALEVTCKDLRWEGTAGALQDSGQLTGLSRVCCFDGSCIAIEPQGATSAPQLWVKMGLWRWDWASKVLLSLAALGACAAALAVALPPGLDVRCVRLPSNRRLPLRAFFLLDGSGSVGSPGWESEKHAAVGIVEAFQSVYAGGKDGGSLHIGAAEFESAVSNVVGMTSDVADASDRIKKMPYNSGGTVYSSALQACQRQLDAYTAAGNRTFDVCVMITDGMCSDDVRTRADVARYLKAGTALFGIFVGADGAGSQNLQAISSQGFFATASDYQELRRKATEVANSIAEASDDRGGIAPSHEPLPEWLPVCLLGLLPAVAWWISLLWPRRQRSARTMELPPRMPPREPLRLRAAGRNEGRDARSPAPAAAR